MVMIRAIIRPEKVDETLKTLAQLLRRNVQITNQNVIRVGQKLNLE